MASFVSLTLLHGAFSPLESSSAATGYLEKTKIPDVLTSLGGRRFSRWRSRQPRSSDPGGGEPAADEVFQATSLTDQRDSTYASLLQYRVLTAFYRVCALDARDDVFTAR